MSVVCAASYFNCLSLRKNNRSNSSSFSEGKLTFHLRYSFIYYLDVKFLEENESCFILCAAEFHYDNDDTHALICVVKIVRDKKVQSAMM